MIELVDNTIFAELAVPDMRIPIQYALTYPGRFKTKVRRVDFSKVKCLSFERPDLVKFPCLGLARDTLKKGRTYPAVLNAADEEAVKRYLEGKIRFSRIPHIIEKALERHKSAGDPMSINDIIEAEISARTEVAKLCYH